MTDFESRTADWLSIGEAVQRILRTASPLDVEEVPLQDALGRALATDLIAPTGLPPWESSAMDGYAVRGADVHGATRDGPTTLTVVGAVLAGTRFDGEVASGQAVRIMTGGPVPVGSDTIVRVEDTDRELGELGRIVIYSDRDQGRHVRPHSEDWSQGDVTLRAGTGIGPGQIGVLASAHAASVSVRRRPVVAILASGDELQDIDIGPPGPDRIAESNSRVVAAAVQLAGCTPERLGIAKDDPDDIRKYFEKARDADVLITLGGASMGEGDLFKRVLDDTDFRLDFWRVKIRPGTPASFGHLPREGRSDQAVFGLPGNPASTFVTFELLVRPFLLALAGHTRLHRTVISARAADDLGASAAITGFLRVTLARAGGVIAASLTGPQGSGLVNSLGTADGLAIIPEGTETISEGSPVDVMLLNDAPGLSEGAPWVPPTQG
jgi:molybdopterin molybdotransferase